MIESPSDHRSGGLSPSPPRDGRGPAGGGGPAPRCAV